MRFTRYWLLLLAFLMGPAYGQVSQDMLRFRAPVAPDSVAIGAPSYSGSTEYLRFSPLYTATSPAMAVQQYQWQYSIDGGTTWKGPDGTSTTIYFAPSYVTSFTSGTLEVRCRALTPQYPAGTASAWVTSSNTTYTSPSSSSSGVILGGVTVVATSNIALSGFPTVDGVGTGAGSIVLCTAETSSVNDGPWACQAGAWTRPSWYPSGSTIPYGDLIWVDQGATYGQTWWMMTATSTIVDTTGSSWAYVLTRLNNGVTGTLPLSNGGTGADLSATGGSGQYVKQVSAGGVLSVGVIAAADLPSVSTSAQGAAPQLPNDASKFLNGVGGWTTPSVGNILPTDYISGLFLSWVSTTQFKVGSGTCYSTASASTITVSSPFTVTPTIAASTIYYVYLTGASSVSVSTTSPTNYQGTAWQNVSGNRYIGSFLTDSSSHIYNFLRVGNIVRYRTSSQVSPFRVLSSGSATSTTSVSCSSVVPATSFRAIAMIDPAANGTLFQTSDGSGPNVIYNSNGGGFTYAELDLNSSQAFQYNNSNASQTAFVDIFGYYEDR